MAELKLNMKQLTNVVFGKRLLKHRSNHYILGKLMHLIIIIMALPQGKTPVSTYIYNNNIFALGMVQSTRPAKSYL